MEALIERVLQEKTESKSITENKRQLFRNRYILYRNTEKEDDFVSVNRIRTTIRSLLSFQYYNEKTVEFFSKNIYSQEKAQNLNAVADYDYSNMNMDEMEYEVQWNKLFFGIGIKRFYGWDDDCQCPRVESINPLSWFPDPYGWKSANSFRYMWFERVTTLYDLKAEWIYENLEDIQTKLTQTQVENRNAEKKGSGMVASQSAIEWQDITVYTHYTCFEWKHYEVTLYDDLPLNIREIAPLEGSKQKFPVALYYYEPIKWDPRWVCIPDLLEDKQKMETLFYNLIKMKAISEGIGWNVYVNRDILQKNKLELSNTSIWRKYIPVDTDGQPVQNHVFHEPQQPVSSDVFNFPQMLSNKADSETWVDALQSGVVSSSAETATESQIAQNNANMHTLLNTKINSRWEKAFRSIWLAFYRFYFSERDQKFIRVNKWITSSAMQLSGKDFLEKNDPDIVIKSSMDAKAKREQRKAQFSALLPMVLQDQNRSKYEKDLFTRLAYENIFDMNRWEVEGLIQVSPEEMQAQREVSLINKNITVNIDPNQQQDHMMFITVYQSALDTPAKRDAITKRTELYIAQVQQQAQMQQAMGQQPQQGQMWGVASSMASQWMSNLIWQQNKAWALAWQ
jgi:hypothetical protein